MGFTQIIVKQGEERLITDFYNKPDSESSLQFYLNREPSFFDALQVEGDDSMVCAVVDENSMQVAGSYIRSTRECFINGQPEKVAYVGSMKIHPRYRGGLVFAKMLRNLHQLGETETRLHYYSVMAGNKQADNLFLSGRPLLPLVKEVGHFSTSIFKPFRNKLKPAFDIVSANQTGFEALVAFLNVQGARKQLFPVYRENHFSDMTSGRLKGLLADDILVAVSNSKIIGTLAIWNQDAFRRWMMYRSQSFKIIRPFINIYSMVKGIPAIPSGHKALSCRYLAVISIMNDDPAVFKNLLYHAMNREKDRQSNALFIMGNFDDDPMFTPLQFPALKLKSRIGCFAWQPQKAFLDSVNFNKAYIETGSL